MRTESIQQVVVTLYSLYVSSSFVVVLRLEIASLVLFCFRLAFVCCCVGFRSVATVCDCLIGFCTVVVFLRVVR